MYLRFAAALAAVGAGAAGLIVVVLLLQSVPGPAPTSSSPAATTAAPSTSPAAAVDRIATPSSPGYPSPPPGAVVLAREAGARVLGLSVKPGLVRVSVLSPVGDPERGLDVTVQVAGGTPLKAKACGSGCYQTDVPRRRPAKVTVQLAGRQYVFALPASVTDGAGIVRKATAAWNDLRSLVWHERLASSPTDAITTVWTAIAPDRLAYTVSGASQAIIIGGTRWDRPSASAQWQKSIQNPPLRQPQPFWHGAADVSVLGTATIAGRPAWRVSFFDPSSPAWFEAWIDRATYRTLELRMTAAAHFMHDVYGPFDAPIELAPPQG